ncbi:phosphopantetheine-binding protein [Enhygromyxa salina]|uniref:phosphopantetheine-binding protein n=1 Tax=Enhygromyxa salina TaxID=215803 RepID=UPI0004E7530C|nr:phosphopantetheine-binding protein [Enhygromyxa salina]
MAFLSKRTRADLTKVDDTAALFSSGVVDSFELASLMVWLEKQTGARINPSDITVDNLDSIARILAYASSR